MKANQAKAAKANDQPKTEAPRLAAVEPQADVEAHRGLMCEMASHVAEGGGGDLLDHAADALDASSDPWDKLRARAVYLGNELGWRSDVASTLRIGLHTALAALRGAPSEPVGAVRDLLLVVLSGLALLEAEQDVEG